MTKRPLHTQSKLIRMSPELLADITEWRRRQPTLASEAEAIRRLIEIGLKAADDRNEQRTALDHGG